MSPLPFSTTTLIAHGGGNVTALAGPAAPLDGEVGFDDSLRANAIASTAASTSAANAVIAPNRRSGFIVTGTASTGSPASSWASRWPIPSAVPYSNVASSAWSAVGN